MSESELAPLLARIADALERLAPPGADDAGLDSAEGFVWHAEGARLEAVPRINRLDISLLKGIDRVRDILLDNTRRFARGLPANNALLWGARGMGKSSLIKAVHGVVAADAPGGLKLIEIHREEIGSLPVLLGRLRGSEARAACSSATTSPSIPRTPPTSPSRRRWRVASAAGPTTSSSTPPPTAAT